MKSQFKRYDKVMEPYRVVQGTDAVRSSCRWMPLFCAGEYSVTRLASMSGSMKITGLLKNHRPEARMRFWHPAGYG
jgi:hypothetical protein